MKNLEKRIDEVFLKYCEHYPSTPLTSTHEKLGAIESTLEGLSLANDDCHEVIEILSKSLGVSPRVAWSIWKFNKGNKL